MFEPPVPKEVFAMIVHRNGRPARQLAYFHKGQWTKADAWFELDHHLRVNNRFGSNQWKRAHTRNYWAWFVKGEKDMRTVTIVGVGALGSHVALLLRSEARLRVVDFDRVEQKNIAAQFHAKGGVGRNKTEALKQLMNFAWGIQIEAVPHKLTDKNADEILTDSDVVIDCLDNGAGRRIIQGWVRDFNSYAEGVDPRQRIELIHGALAPGGNFGQAVWDDNFVIDDESATGAATCEGGEFLPFIVSTASFIARAVQLYLRERIKVGFMVHPGGASRV